MLERMKVALLSDCFLPRLGGIEVQVHDLATHLLARGHEVEVFTATAGPRGERRGRTTSLDGVTVHHHALRLPWDLPVNPLAPLRMRAELEGFDVAHAHMGVVSPFAVDSALLTMRMGLPTAMTWHCMLDTMAPVVRGLGVVRRWAAAGMAMSAVSEVAASPLRRIIGDAGRVDVLPNGIDVAAWTPPRTPPGDGVVRVVTAMRLARRKRPVPFVRLLRRVRDLVPDDVRLEVEILGEGPERGAVEDYLGEHAMTSWVRLPGRLSRDELKARYAAADVYVSPGELESFGIAALEARTVGLPVVGRQGCGISEFVSDGVNGYLASDDDDLAAALVRLVSDPALRQRMTRHNVERPPTQSWASVVAVAEGQYARALAGARR
ncbi:MAG: glycosyltransferase family 4 protein [Actinomycetota bacterium]|nr:glycosyltransferase family 4 protein [Actinomycetota bacterium]